MYLFSPFGLSQNEGQCFLCSICIWGIFLYTLLLALIMEIWQVVPIVNRWYFLIVLSPYSLPFNLINCTIHYASLLLSTDNWPLPHYLLSNLISHYHLQISRSLWKILITACLTSLTSTVLLTVFDDFNIQYVV